MRLVLAAWYKPVITDERWRLTMEIPWNWIFPKPRNFVSGLESNNRGCLREIWPTNAEATSASSCWLFHQREDVHAIFLFDAGFAGAPKWIEYACVRVNLNFRFNYDAFYAFGRILQLSAIEVHTCRTISVVFFFFIRWSNVSMYLYIIIFIIIFIIYIILYLSIYIFIYSRL